MSTSTFVDRDIYISTDVETSGPVPGLYSMLSLGMVAYDATGKELGTWYGKFTMLPQSDWHLGTLKWWQGWKNELAEATSDQVQWQLQSENFIQWIESWKTGSNDVVMMASPATFDGSFINYYGVGVRGDFSGLPWKHRFLDIRTYIHAVLKMGFRASIGKKSLELLEYTDTNPAPHMPVDDARAQGEMYFAARKFREEKLYKKSSTWITPKVNTPGPVSGTGTVVGP